MAVTATGRPGSSGTNSLGQNQAERVQYLDLSATDGLTALVGGAQAGTSVANYSINRFTTVTSANDSAQLPPALPGRIRIVINSDAANALAVFPQTGEIINALSANASFSLAANKTAIFFCALKGTWNSNLTA